MREGKNMGIMTAFKKPTPEREGGPDHAVVPDQTHGRRRPVDRRVDQGHKRDRGKIERCHAFIRSVEHRAALPRHGLQLWQQAHHGGTRECGEQVIGRRWVQGGGPGRTSCVPAEQRLTRSSSPVDPAPGRARRTVVRPPMAHARVAAVRPQTPGPRRRQRAVERAQERAHTVIAVHVRRSEVQRLLGGHQEIAWAQKVHHGVFLLTGRGSAFFRGLPPPLYSHPSCQ
jgi:hypothetical protein